MRRLFVTFIAACAVFAVRGQATDPTVVSTGLKLPARTLINPFASEAELKSGTTSLVIRMSDWTWKQVTEGVEFTATFKRPTDWASRGVILRIAGASSSYAVDVNGVRAAYNQWGMGRAEFDITKLTKEFYNTVTITIYGSAVATRLEAERGHDNVGFETVEVISQPSVRVQDILVDAAATGTRGTFMLRLAMQSTILNNRNLMLQYELIAPNGKVVAKDERPLSLATMKADTLTFRVANLDKVDTWTVASPKLYTLIVRSIYDGRPIEIIARQVGFTEVSFTRDGYFLVAGKPTQLITYEMGWLGSREATEKQMRRAKAQKANAILVDGYSQPDEFYTLADLVGMYVIDRADIATGGTAPNPGNDPQWLGAFRERVLGTYQASRVHPSVVAYIMARNSGLGYCLSETYLAYKRVEKRRPLIYPEVGADWCSDAIVISVLILND